MHKKNAAWHGNGECQTAVVKELDLERRGMPSLVRPVRMPHAFSRCKGGDGRKSLTTILACVPGFFTSLVQCVPPLAGPVRMLNAFSRCKGGDGRKSLATILAVVARHRCSLFAFATCHPPDHPTDGREEQMQCHRDCPGRKKTPRFPIW